MVSGGGNDFGLRMVVDVSGGHWSHIYPFEYDKKYQKLKS